MQDATMKLYPFQEEGVRFLTDRSRAYLADEMGLGKTAQVIVAAGEVDAQNTLVICPASVIPTWRSEWRKWGGPGEPTLLSYAKAHKLIPPHDFDLVVLDEAHYVKNPDALRSASALALAVDAERKWLVSGTPMPNNPSELFAPVRKLWPQWCALMGLSSHWDWIDYFCEWAPTDYGPKIYASKNREILRALLDKIMLRRTLDNVALELPPLRTHVYMLPADEVFAETLRAVLHEMFPHIDTTLFDASEWLQTLSGGSVSRLRHILGEYKTPHIAALIGEELEAKSYEKIVLLGYHRRTLELLEEKLGAYGTVVMHGGHSTKQRESRIKTFNEDPDVRVFIGQNTAAGVGITLTAASEIVLVEPAWSPEDNRQGIKRIHRIGQDAPCRARIFGVSDSLDENIMDSLARKMRMIEGVLE